MSFSIIDELIEALEDEIKAVKRGKNGNSTRVVNGKFLRQTTELYIYEFTLENFLVALDDMPAEIRISGNHYECHVVSCAGQSIQIALDKSVGDVVAEADLLTNLWFLLEMLAKKFREAKEKEMDFTFSRQVFSGLSQKIEAGDLPKYEEKGNPPNPSQRRAIEYAYENSLSVIWGPPGTGKTKTIANLIEAHLRADRSVLLVSHANAAVDQALASVAKQLKNTPYYEDGRLIRLGVTHNDTLDKEHPLVILEKVVETKGRALTARREGLVTESLRWEALLSSLEELVHTVDISEEQIHSLAELERLLAKLEEAVEDRERKIQISDGRLRKLQHRHVLAIQSSGIKRLFLGLNPEKIEKEIEQLHGAIEQHRTKLVQYEEERGILETKIATQQSLIKETDSRLRQLLEQHGINQNELKAKVSEAQNTVKVLEAELSEINQELEQLTTKIMQDCSLIATTLTKTFSSRQFPQKAFDVIIIDESSMAPLPQVYWACNFATSHVTIVGDFNQLPPIGIASTSMAVKWLRRSIFDVIGVNSVDLAERAENVTLLDTQYRMAPPIAKVSSELFYNNLLKSAHLADNNKLEDPWTFGDNPLILVDTSEVNPWSSRLSSSGFFNIYNALVSVSIAKSFALVENPPSIGVATPFRAQARLIRKIAEDWGLAERIRVDTIHSFQGGEEDVMIIDTVEASGMGRWSIFDESRKDFTAQLILNVALTRARKKVFFISHKVHHTKILDIDFSLCRLLELFVQNGVVLPSDRVIGNYLDVEFDKWVERYVDSTAQQGVIDSSLYTQDSFWGAFFSDLQTASEQVTILSPFTSMNRTSQLFPFFHDLVRRGVEIKIYTRPPERQGGSLVEHAKEAIAKFEEYGISVILRNSMHQKVALIDHDIAWEGSLNILSHNNTEEQMRRLLGKNTVKEIKSNLELDQEYGDGDLTRTACPSCGGQMVVRRGRYGTFLGCNRFPKCKHTEQIRKSVVN